MYDAFHSIRRFAFADAVIIVFIICGVFASFGAVMTSAPDRVVVFRQNAVVAEYSVADDAAFTVNGKRGPVDVEIKDGAAMIRHADCPRKVCQMSNAIRRSHEQLICAPNNILIEIRSSKKNHDVDGISY